MTIDSSKILVPHMTAWSTEAAPAVSIRFRSGRLIYTDERPDDRDEHGILWTRSHQEQGGGRPTFGRVHTARQREAVARMLCQVCGVKAKPVDGRYLWLTDLSDVEGLGRFDEKWTTSSYPPICQPCLETSVARCPALRKGFAILTVTSSEPFGVRGIEFHKKLWRPVQVESSMHHYPYGHPALSRVLATQQVSALHGVALTEWKH